MHDGGTGARSSGVARLVVGPVGSGVTHRLAQDGRAVRCVGLESAVHPFEAFMSITCGGIRDDPAAMAHLVRTALDGARLAVDDAHLLAPMALDVIVDLARDHDVAIGAHPGEGNWDALRDRWPDVALEWVDRAPVDVVRAVVAAVSDTTETDRLVAHVGPLLGVGRALATDGPLAAATRERLRSVVEHLRDDALAWIVDASLLLSADDRSVLAVPPAASRALSFPHGTVPPIVTELLHTVIGPDHLADRRRALAGRVSDSVVRSRLLLDAGDADAARSVASAALASTDDPDDRATLATLAAHDDDSSVLAATLLVQRERPHEALGLLGEVQDPERVDAVRAAAAARRQLDRDDRWAFVDRLPADDQERRRQSSWFDAALDGEDSVRDDARCSSGSSPLPDPMTAADLDSARWVWTLRAVAPLYGRDGLGPVADAVDGSVPDASWRQFVRQLRALDQWHRTGPSRHSVEELRSEFVPALPRVVLATHCAIGLADLGDTAAALQLVSALPTTTPSERLLVTWAAAEAELAAGRPIGAMRTVAELDAAAHPLAGLSQLVRAWAAWDAGEPNEPTTPPGGWTRSGWVIGRATDIELDAIALLRAGDPGTAARSFEDAAECWRTVHARGELRCRFGAAEARRLAGEARLAIERLTVLEGTCTEHGYGPLLQRVRRSLRLAGVRRRGRRSAGTGPLSPREVEVIELVGKGLTTRDIATRLGLAPATVETQIAGAMHKLGARTRLQAALTYRELAP